MIRFKITRLVCLVCFVLVVCWPSLAAAEMARTPVLFVHGINNDKGTFADWTTGLSAAKSESGDFKLYQSSSPYFEVGVPVFVVDYSGGGEKTHRDINKSAKAISWAIAEIKQLTGSDRVFVVTYSMGGLLTRVYLEGLGGLKYNDDVAGLVTLDTPHQGSAFADSGNWGANEAAARWMGGWWNSDAGQQMDPDSEFLKKLNSTDYVDKKGFMAVTEVASNHYPLLGDGLLTVPEQTFDEPDRTPSFSPRDYRIVFVDAVHNAQIGEWYYQELLKNEGKLKGEPNTSVRPIYDTVEAIQIVKAAYGRVGQTYEKNVSEAELRSSLTVYLREQGKKDNPYHPRDNTVEAIQLVKDGNTWWATAAVVPVEPTMEQLSYIAKRVGGKWETVTAGSDPYPEDGTYVPKAVLKNMGYE